MKKVGMTLCGPKLNTPVPIPYHMVVTWKLQSKVGLDLTTSVTNLDFHPIGPARIVMGVMRE